MGGPFSKTKKESPSAPAADIIARVKRAIDKEKAGSNIRAGGDCGSEGRLYKEGQFPSPLLRFFFFFIFVLLSHTHTQQLKEESNNV